MSEPKKVYENAGSKHTLNGTRIAASVFTGDEDTILIEVFDRAGQLKSKFHLLEPGIGTVLILRAAGDEQNPSLIVQPSGGQLNIRTRWPVEVFDEKRG